MKRRGLALVLVLWVLALLLAVVGAFALGARIEALQGRNARGQVQARWAAEAGIEWAAQRMRDPQLARRLVPDGRAYPVPFEGAQVQVAVHDESGKLDLNTADPESLARLFEFFGEDEERALSLADAIADWRDPDDLLRLRGAEDGEYAAADLPYGAKDAPFAGVDELQRVLGMSAELYARAAPYLTVFSGRAVNAAFAEAPVLAALDLDPATAEQYLADRARWTPDSGEPPPPPGGGEAGAAGAVTAAGSGTYSIEGRAILADATRVDLRLTLRVGVPDRFGRVYTVLDRREGDGLR